MSEVAARTARPRHGRGFDLLAMLAIGLVIVAAALLPAVTANSGETVTVRGDVTLNGRPLPFFPVGFWTTAGKPINPTTTDANGGFTFDVPATVDGYAYAGTTPDSQHTILDIDGEHVVRGIISSEPAGSPASPLYQGRPTATGRSLANGASQVHFRLQKAGRISGTSPLKADRLRAVQVRRADNSVVETLRLDSRSRFRSRLLTPGQYGVVLVPRSPALPTVADAVVRGGATTPVSLPTPEAGATVLGTVRTAAGGVGAGVPVLLEQQGEVLASTRTAANGDWSFAGVAAGDYSIEVGRFDLPDAGSASASAVEVPIPGATSTPTPTPAVPTATSSATPTTPAAAALAPVERTADAVLPQTFTATVPQVLGEVSVSTEVQEAGRITGVVSRPTPITGTDTAPVRVVVEEAATSRVVRTASAGADGRYDVAGLVPGTRYRVWAVTQPADATVAEMGSATATAQTTAAVADIAVDEPALTLSGTVAGVEGGRVSIGDAALLQRSGTIDSSGAYAVQGLVPGAYPAVVTATGRTASSPVGVVVSADQPLLDLQPGARPAVFKGWFISSGAGVPAITGSALDPEGDVVRFGPRTNGGRVEIDGLRPGTYEYDPDSFRGTVPALDGPWYFAPPSGSFSLSDGATTDVGPIVLHTFSH
jgi:hypothetical protein